MAHKGLKTGNGSWENLTKERAAQAREIAINKKKKAMAEYEARVIGTLENISKLQHSVIELANDPHSTPDKNEMEKLRLGLSAAEQILNRVMGKPTTRIEAEVNHSVLDDMSSVDAEWIIEQ
jgi:hypothetical protein